MIILIILTVFVLTIGILGCLASRRNYINFNLSLERYHKFLLSYEETPRSKMVKKYLPPLDPLMEVVSAFENTNMSLIDTMNRESALSFDDLSASKVNVNVRNSLNSSE